MLGHFFSGVVPTGDDPYRRRTIAVLVAIAIAVVHVFTLGDAFAAQSNSPLPGGSTFQGADGNQDNADPLTDWQFYADTAPGNNTAVTKLDAPVGTGNPAGPDSFYAGHEDTPDDWTLSSNGGGVNPPKSNAFAASSVRDPLQSKTFFYFAFIRELDANSDAFYGVELNQRTNTWVNSKGTTIPCRSTGDLMISYHIDANTKNVNVSAHRWQGNDQSATHPECPTGGSGTFASVTLGINAQGHMNFESTITNYLRRDALGTTLTAGRFGEGAINLSDTIGTGANPCFNFGQVQLHSRSSNSFDSALQDTVDPAPIAVRNCSVSGTKFRDDNGDGVRQAGEPGLAGWTFWVDYDDDGVIDANEPSGVSDATGAYTIANVNPAAQGQGANTGPFRIHERAPAGVTGYTCTYPNAGTANGGVDAHGCYWLASFTSTGNQAGFDFGNRPPGRVVIRKVNVGGTQSDAFAFSTTGLGGDFTLAATSATGQVFDGVAPGSHTVTEGATGQPAGYRLTDIDCDDTDSTQALNADRRATIEVAAGETVTCTFTNTKDATLTVVKSVVNDHGGTAVAGDFSLHVTQGGADVGGSPAPGSAGKAYSLAPGTYAVSEDTPVSGYTMTGITVDCSTNGSITLAAGESKTCTVTNDDIAPQLTVIKSVTNNHGGTKGPGDFTMNVTGTEVSDDSFPGADGAGTTVTLDAGQYSVDEGAHDGYAKSLSADCSGQIAIGESKTCTVTNDDIAAKLIVVKHVENRAGSTGQASDFQITVDDEGSNPPSFPGAEAPGTEVAVDPGAYSVDEVEDSRYAKSLSQDCAGTIAAGETKTCTITNTRRTGTLEVVKRVLPAGDLGRFDLQIDGVTQTGPNGAGDNGTTGAVAVSSGTHTVGEAGHAGTDLARYSASTSCADAQGAPVSVGANGAVTVGDADAIVCTITNTLITNPAIDVEKWQRRGSSGPFSAESIDVHVGDTVEYKIDVANHGDTPLAVEFSDEGCDPGTLTGPEGDDNSNDLLDPDERFTWHCSRVVRDSDGSEVVNVAKATGVDPLDREVDDTDKIEARVLHPAISVDKTGPATAQAGERVTYAIAVSNTGDVPFEDPRVVVTDALCEAPPQLATRNGDASPATLDPGDTWTYTCTVQTQAGQTEVDNVAVVDATDPNGRPVSARDNAVTALTQPQVEVKPVRVVPGTAKLRGPTGCIPARRATVAVTGQQIRSVTFYVDGRKIRKVRSASADKKWTLRLRPGAMRHGTHRVRARVVFTTASGTQARTLGLTFTRCRARVAAPKFTG